jgi:hypothetical protein
MGDSCRAAATQTDARRWMLRRGRSTRGCDRSRIVAAVQALLPRDRPGVAPHPPRRADPARTRSRERGAAGRARTHAARGTSSSPRLAGSGPMRWTSTPQPRRCGHGSRRSAPTAAASTAISGSRTWRSAKSRMRKRSMPIGSRACRRRSVGDSDLATWARVRAVIRRTGRVAMDRRMLLSVKALGEQSWSTAAVASRMTG